MQALAQSDPGSPVAGLLLATLAAVLFAVGAVLQHEAAELSTTDRGLSLRLLMKRKRWMLGQTATMSGTGTQVAALAVAPVAVVQPMLAVALVVVAVLVVTLLRSPAEPRTEDPDADDGSAPDHPRAEPDRPASDRP